MSIFSSFTNGSVNNSNNWRIFKRKKLVLNGYSTAVFAMAIAATSPMMASAAPTGGAITQGTGSISVSGVNTNISQSSQILDINWNTFSTAVNETVNFSQPNVSAIAINRVIGGVPSQLRGALNADGNVYILNESGITFFDTSRVNVNSLLATTAMQINSIGDVMEFSGVTNGSVINHGDIRVSNGGWAILAAPYVENTGLIIADLGQIELASATEFTIDLRGDNLITYTLSDELLVRTGVTNTGLLQAKSGRIALSANVASDIVSSVVNLDGVVDVTAFSSGGRGGEVKITSVLDVFAGDLDTTGARLLDISTTDGADISTGSLEANDRAGSAELIVNGSGDVSIFGSVSAFDLFGAGSADASVDITAVDEIEIEGSVNVQAIDNSGSGSRNASATLKIVSEGNGVVQGGSTNYDIEIGGDVAVVAKVIQDAAGDASASADVEISALNSFEITGVVSSEASAIIDFSLLVPDDELSVVLYPEGDASAKATLNLKSEKNNVEVDGVNVETYARAKNGAAYADSDVSLVADDDVEIGLDGLLVTSDSYTVDGFATAFSDAIVNVDDNIKIAGDVVVESKSELLVSDGQELRSRAKSNVDMDASENIEIDGALTVTSAADISGDSRLAETYVNVALTAGNITVGGATTLTVDANSDTAHTIAYIDAVLDALYDVNLADVEIHAAATNAFDNRVQSNVNHKTGIAVTHVNLNVTSGVSAMIVADELENVSDITSSITIDGNLNVTSTSTTPNGVTDADINVTLDANRVEGYGGYRDDLEDDELKRVADVEIAGNVNIASQSSNENGDSQGYALTPVARLTLNAEDDVVVGGTVDITSTSFGHHVSKALSALDIFAENGDVDLNGDVTLDADAKGETYAKAKSVLKVRAERGDVNTQSVTATADAVSPLAEVIEGSASDELDSDLVGSTTALATVEVDIQTGRFVEQNNELDSGYGGSQDITIAGDLVATTSATSLTDSDANTAVTIATQNGDISTQAVTATANAVAQAAVIEVPEPEGSQQDVDELEYVVLSADADANVDVVITTGSDYAGDDELALDIDPEVNTQDITINGDVTLRSTATGTTSVSAETYNVITTGGNYITDKLDNGEFEIRVPGDITINGNVDIITIAQSDSISGGSGSDYASTYSYIVAGDNGYEMDTVSGGTAADLEINGDVVLYTKVIGATGVRAEGESYTNAEGDVTITGDLVNEVYAIAPDGILVGPLVDQIRTADAYTEAVAGGDLTVNYQTVEPTVIANGASVIQTFSGIDDQGAEYAELVLEAGGTITIGGPTPPPSGNPGTPTASDPTPPSDDTPVIPVRPIETDPAPTPVKGPSFIPDVLGKKSENNLSNSAGLGGIAPASGQTGDEFCSVVNTDNQRICNPTGTGSQ